MLSWAIFFASVRLTFRIVLTAAAATTAGTGSGPA